MGNAVLIAGVFALLLVHPHVHGERSGEALNGDADTGSSPRTWGTLMPVEKNG